MTNKDNKSDNNPYHTTLLEAAAIVLTKTPTDLVDAHTMHGKMRWAEKNEWINASIATYLLIGAHAYATPGSELSKSKTVLRWATTYIEFLLDSSEGGRWYHLKPSMGDRNTDRFTLIPFVEAIRMLQDDLPTELSTNVRSRLAEIFDVQFREYGHTANRRIYPNMDAYYCLAMYFAAEMTAERRYQDEFERTLRRLDSAQYEDGGWAYIDTMNESPNYHRVTGVVMARIAHLSEHPLALKQMRRCVNYYPKSLTLDFAEEYHTNCWWKHGWEVRDFESWTADVTASFTGDGVNRWIADQCREKTNERLIKGLAKFDNAKRLAAVYAAITWQPVDPVARTAGGIIHDANIDGPRGHYDHWSWAATARNGCDTVVGARLCGSDRVVALMGVIGEIPVIPEMDVKADDLRNRWSKGAMPPQTVGFSIFDKSAARFRVAYQMVPYRTDPAKQDPLPRHWLCRQDWTLEAMELRGTLTFTALEEHITAPPIVRIRLGLDSMIEQIDADCWRFDNMLIRVIDGCAFPHRTVVPARTSHSVANPNALELVLRTEPKVNEVPHRLGENHTLTLAIQYDTRH